MAAGSGFSLRIRKRWKCRRQRVVISFLVVGVYVFGLSHYSSVPLRGLFSLLFSPPTDLID